MNKHNKLIGAGLLISGVTICLNRFAPSTPDFILGLGFGLGIGLELFGAYAVYHDLNKFREKKFDFFKRCISK